MHCGSRSSCGNYSPWSCSRDDSCSSSSRNSCYSKSNHSVTRYIGAPLCDCNIPATCIPIFAPYAKMNYYWGCGNHNNPYCYKKCQFKKLVSKMEELTIQAGNTHGFEVAKGPRCSSNLPDSFFYAVVPTVPVFTPPPPVPPPSDIGPD